MHGWERARSQHPWSPHGWASGAPPVCRVRSSSPPCLLPPPLAQWTLGRAADTGLATSSSGKGGTPRVSSPVLGPTIPLCPCSSFLQNLSPAEPQPLSFVLHDTRTSQRALCAETPCTHTLSMHGETTVACTVHPRHTTHTVCMQTMHAHSNPHTCILYTHSAHRPCMHTDTLCKHKYTVHTSTRSLRAHRYTVHT